MMYVLNQKLSWIFELSALKFKIFWEVVYRLFCSSLIDNLSLDHQKQSVEFVEDVAVGLMDRHQHCFPLLVRQLGQIVHNHVGCQGIEAWCGLIKHYHLRITNQLKGYRRSLLLSAWNPFDSQTTDKNVHTI